MNNKLIAFAFLKDSFSDENGSIRAFKDIFEVCLYAQRGRVLDIEAFVTSLKENFGISMPVKAAQGLKSSLGMLDLVYEEKEQHLSHYRVKSDLSKPNFEDPAIDTIFAEIDNFSKLHKFYYDGIENDFFSWLTNDLEKDIGDKLTSSSSENIKFSYFVRYLQLSKEDLFNRLADLYSGCLIAEAVLVIGGGKSEAGNLHLENVKFYIDAPIILDYLDVNLKENFSYFEEVVSLINKFGGQVYTFSHCVEEAEKILKSISYSFDQNITLTNEIGQRVRENKSHIFRVKRLANNLMEALESLNIKVLDPKDLERSASFFKPFSKELESEVASSISTHQEISPRLLDAKSIPTIARLRKFESPKKLRLAKHVFITRNTVVAKVSQRFQSQSPDARKDSLPYCFLDSSLAAYLWVNFGFESNGISRKRLVSLCASSLAPKSSIVSNVKELLAGDKEYTNDFLLIIDDRESAEYAVFLNAQKKYLTADDYRMNIDEVKGMIADKARAKVEAEYRPLKKKADRIIEQRKREIKKRKSIIESLKDERVKGRRMGKIVHYGIVSILLVFSVSSFLWQNFEHSTYFSIFAIFCAFIVQFGKSDFLMKKVADFYLARKAKKLDFFNVLKRIGTHR